MLSRAAASLVIFSMAGLIGCAARRPGSVPQPGFNLFSKQQDIQLGHEAAAQVRQQYEVVSDTRLQDYVHQLGGRLAATAEAAQSGFPFEYTLLNERQVNAFALPGGPTFVFSALIVKCENEAQLAGVLAHEISHVILRHGTNQLSKANLVQLPAALAGAALGQGTLAELVKAGLGVGLTGLFLHYSREDESQADQLGAHIMAEAGYNPIEMARFFELLEAQGGAGVPQFLSDHPSPGNRVRAVESEIRTLPKRQYGAGTGMFDMAKQRCTQLPPPAKHPPQ